MISIYKLLFSNCNSITLPHTFCYARFMLWHKYLYTLPPYIHPSSFPNAFSTRACPDFTKAWSNRSPSKRKVSFSSVGEGNPCSPPEEKVGESRRKAHHSWPALFSSWMEEQGEGNSMPCRPECGPLFCEARRGWEPRRGSGGKGSRTRKFGRGRGRKQRTQYAPKRRRSCGWATRVDVCVYTTQYVLHVDICNRWKVQRKPKVGLGYS